MAAPETFADAAATRSRSPCSVRGPGLSGTRRGPPFPAGLLHVSYLNGYQVLGLKARQPFRVKLNALFPPLVNRAARGGGACLSGTGRRGQGRGRRTDPRGGRATCTRRASCFRLPSGPEPPLQGRGNPVGAGWEENAGRAPLAAIFFRLRAKSPDLLSASGDFQEPCSILKHPTWVFQQTCLGYFRR